MRKNSGIIYKINLSKQAEKDAKKILATNLDAKLKKIINELKADPFNESYHYEKLKYELSGKHSKRISYQHRLVYSVDEKNKVIYIYRMWSHYEKL